MIKFTRGSITNPVTGVTKDIMVKAASANNLKEILIGGGLVVAGIAYLTVSAFKNGAGKFDDAYLQTLGELGLLCDDVSEITK